jgi:ATP-dependent Clp protease ATP-binding subunit ClpA
VDFTPTVIILTSNVGSTELAAKAGEGGIGFATPASTINDDEMKEIAMSAARRKFSPEFLNRLDDVVMFSTLTPANLVDILRIELDKLRAQIVLTSRVVFDIEISPAAKSKLLAEGYDKKYNARELRRVVERRVAQPLGRLVTTAQIMDNDTVICDYDGEWKYFAKGTPKPRVSEPSIQSGRVEVPTLRISPESTPPSPDLPEPWRSAFSKQSSDAVLEVPRRSPQPFFERRGYKRHLQ